MMVVNSKKAGQSKRLDQILLLVLFVLLMGWLSKYEQARSRRELWSDLFVEEENIMKVLNKPVQLPRSELQIVPMEGKTFGAYVYNFDPSEELNEDVMGQIRNAVEKHLVLVFANVSQKLTPEMHLEFGRLIGPVDPAISGPPSYLKHGKFNSPDQVDRALRSGGKSTADLGATMLKAAQEGKVPHGVTRIVKEPSDLIAFGEGWHTDLSYRPATPFVAALVERQLPSTGGNTHYIDMRAAYDRLPKEVQQQLETLQANHTDGAGLFSIHPAVRTDNKYGSKTLFVNKAFTRNMVPQTPELLENLLDYVEHFAENNADAFLDIDWEHGQMVIWDNRFTQHKANADYTERREMHRVVVSGTVPF